MFHGTNPWRGHNNLMIDYLIYSGNIIIFFVNEILFNKYNFVGGYTLRKKKFQKEPFFVLYNYRTLN